MRVKQFLEHEKKICEFKSDKQLANGKRDTNICKSVNGLLERVDEPPR